MKYSIIIVAYGAMEFLDKCLLSIDCSAIEDYEIIIVDNSPNPCIFGPLIKYHHDGKNHGFAEGCNIGARMAKGEILIFLNPDTEVYGDWADQMAKYLEDDVGAVGPISNFVAGQQRVDFHMQQAETPEETAERAAWALKGRAVETKLIIGFCCMIRKEVYEKMGGMDPDLFLGNDDLDLSWRLRLAGYTLLVASDVFVYHAGHKSFETRPRPEVQKLLQESEDALRTKLNTFYQGNPPSAVELWGAEFFNTEMRRPMTLSVCMIVRNEADKVLFPINDMQDVADECVVVDTGSEDGTIDVLRQRKPSCFWMPESESLDRIKGYGHPVNEALKVYRFTWNDDFADARNFALSKCTGDYILWLDADDRVPEKAGKLIRAALQNPGPKTWNKKVFFEFTVEDMEKGGVGRRFFQPRLFPNLHKPTWEGRIHESILPVMERHGIEPFRTDITIQHTGYMTAEDRQRKAERNIRILNLDEDSPFKFYNIGQALAMAGRWAEAKQEYDKTLTMEWPEPLWPPFRDQTRVQAIKCLLNLGRKDDLEPYLEGNTAPDAVYYGGLYLEWKNERWRAIELYRRYLEITHKMPNWPYEVDSPKNRAFAYAGMINLLADEHAEWLKRSEAELQAA